MKTIEIVNCRKCGKTFIKRKCNHAYCSINCSRTDHSKKKELSLLEIRKIASDIMSGLKRRSCLTKIGLSPTDKKRIDNYIEKRYYGNN